jgi:8-oxo-dGTP pyrophosphatase MutT (NUDIX family)
MRALGKSGVQPLRAMAVCYRRKRCIEYLLVRTRGGRWTVPGGGIEPRESPTDAAAREALEEAGVQGRISAEPFAWIVPLKGPSGHRMGLGARTPVFLLEVERTQAPAEAYRCPRWCSQAEAEQLLRVRRTSWSARRRARLLRFASDAISVSPHGDWTGDAVR